MAFFNFAMYTWYRLNLDIDSNFLNIRDHQITKIINLTLTADLESEGQDDVYMTSLIIGCIHDT